MQYLVSVIDDKPGSTTPAEQAAINVFDDRPKAEGYWLFAAGLAAPSTSPSSTTEAGSSVHRRALP